jgi:hypothetical protein
MTRRKKVIEVDFTKVKDPEKYEKKGSNVITDLTGYTKISQSRINKWRQCRYAHHLAFNEKIEKKTPPAPLYKGKILHELIEARINGQDWGPVLDEYIAEFNKMFDEEKEVYGDLPNDLRIIMEGYDKMHEDEGLEYILLDGKRAEHDFAIKIHEGPCPVCDGAGFTSRSSTCKKCNGTGQSGVAFVGKIDTVVRDSHDRVWLMEHKSFTKLPDEQFRWTNQQATLYSWVMPQIGFPFPNGVLWDYIRTKVPTQPEPLKSGGLSKAKKVDTTYEVYLSAIHQNGLNPDDYQDILEKLKGNEQNYYRRIFLPSRKAIQEPIVNDTIETAVEIHQIGELSKTRNLGRHCSFCSYKSICQIELMGGDSDFVKKAEYRPSTYHLNVEEGDNGEN